MRKILKYAAGFIFFALSFISCEKSCKICQQNTYNSSGTLLTEGTEAEYCDVKLISIEATDDYTLLGVTYRWVCR